MPKFLAVWTTLLVALLLTPIVTLAATSSAQIVDCPAIGCFSPNPIRVNAGDSVTWTNNASVTHTATSNTGAWDTGNINSGATSAAIVFPTAGTFPYHCAIHPNMTGTVIVSAAAAAPSATPAPVRRLATGGSGPLPLNTAAVLLFLGAGLVLGGGRLLATGGRRDRSQRL